MIRSVPGVVVVLLLGGALLAVGLWADEEVRFSPACPPGIGRGLWDPGWLGGRGSGPAGGEARKLLEDPNFGATPEAARDLEAGIVDERLVGALLIVAGEHRICVDAFKEGHYFVPGVRDGPRIPEGYGKAGGLPNTHYFGRAADIRWVDGKPVEDNGLDRDVLDVGRTLAGIPPEKRPDQIIGPPRWTKALGYGREEGWILDADQLELHRDHIHLGYMSEKGTSNAP